MSNIESNIDWYRLKDFFINRYGTGLKLRPDTQLEKGLGITGDDAVELMNDFFEFFKIDVYSFNYLDHFDSEGYSLFFWKKNKKKKEVLTLFDLYEMIQAGEYPDKKTSNYEKV